MAPKLRNPRLLYAGVLLATGLFLLSAGYTLREPAEDNTPTCSCGSLQVNFSGTVPGDAFLFGNQTNANCFAWAEFIALNWPSDTANGFGTPGDHNPVNWETYMPRNVLFPPQGAAPPSWGTLVASSEVAAFKNQHLLFDTQRTKVLISTSKFESISANQFDSTNTGQAFPFDAPNWLGAQNGTNVWYEVLLNKDVYDFVVTNKYYNAQNQYNAVMEGKPIVFPQGTYNGAVGAIELKAAWMEVTDPQNAKWNRYKLSSATVLDPNTGKLRPTTVALVGLHILHKTAKQPTWVWATFEHVDNAPDAGATPTGTYNFFNAACASKSVIVPAGCLAPNATSPVSVSCQPNTPPPYYLCPGGPGPTPTQVVRETPIDGNAVAVNKTMQAQIASLYPKSVWQNYQLVNVIWSTTTQADPTTPIASPRVLNASYMQPNIPVANATLETYIQKTTCTGCHTGSTIAPSPTNMKPDTFGDFSFAIGFAQYPTPVKVRRRR